MAKGIRSKRMRKNRAGLRKSFAQPIVDKRQEKIAQAIEDQLKEKRGETIKALKNVLSSGVKLRKVKAAAMEVVQDVAEKKTEDKAKKVKARIEIIKTKASGSKARPNPTKQLEWFS